MYRKILVAVDGSHTAQLGLKEAIRLAKDQAATLHLLHVVDEMSVTLYPEVAYYAGDLLESLREGGRKVLAKAETEVEKNGLKARQMLIDSRAGTVADVIVAQAKKVGADVIVLGTHGRRGLSHLLMGSDAESVVRYAAVPVLLVRAPARRKGKARA